MSSPNQQPVVFISTDNNTYITVDGRWLNWNTWSDEHGAFIVLRSKAVEIFGDSHVLQARRWFDVYC
jgi:hypothetical protein